MLKVIGCIYYDHNIWLVLVAAAVCAAGSWATIRLFQRAATAKGMQQIGWHFLTAVGGGASIWCTHFIAMLAYAPGAPVDMDPILTILSLLVAMIGTCIGFVLAAGAVFRPMPLIGGAVVGTAVSTMHYTGMLAYRVQGFVGWDMAYLVASIVMAVLFCALSMSFAMRVSSGINKAAATVSLVVGIVSLHFTAMTALEIQPILIDLAYTNPQAMEALALAVAVVTLIITGAGMVSYLIDDQVRAESHQQLMQMAMNDNLTGLPNRSSFNAHLDHEIYLARETGGRLALVSIDLDSFKEINDLKGHAIGDAVLQVVARRLAALLRDGEFVARVGGDEFAAVYRQHDHGSLDEFLSRLEGALSREVRLEGHELSLQASLGVSFYPDDADCREGLANNTTLAMYRAKADRSRTVCFYEQSMDETVRARRALAADLRQAAEKGELQLHYQVQTRVNSGEVCGFEALLRWVHPRKGVIPPSDFIPLAEENGLIVELGDWVLRQACLDAAVWDQPYKVAVNLSPAQFSHSCLPERVQEVLAETGLPADRLELELTETTIIEDKERSLAILNQIRKLGVSIALDDFGTGYSSLDTLRSFPFDKIKLDRSFVIELEESKQARAIIRAVLALSRSLDIPVLAEGVETSGQISLLEKEGCHEAQGYLLGRPLPQAELRSKYDVAPDPAEEQIAYEFAI